MNTLSRSFNWFFVLSAAPVHYSAGAAFFAVALGAACGAWSFLWCRVLTAPGMAGNIVPRTYWKIMGEWKEWKAQLAKPLFDCPVCHSFWIALFFHVFSLFMVATCEEGFIGVVAALFFAYYLDRKYE